MASASDHRAHAALQPADCLILLPQRLPAAVETSIGPAHYPAECTQSDAFLQPSLRARYGRANSNSFRARISPEIVLFALAAGSALRQLSPCDYVRFWRWAPNASMNLPPIKRASSPHYTVIRVKTSFCSATYRPKEHRPIYRDLGALVHSKYLHHSVQHNALIVGRLVALVILRVHGRTTKRSTRCFRRYGLIITKDVRSDAAIP